MQLRDYQVKAVSDISAAFAAGYKRLILIAPTGSGKTVVASAMIRRMVATKKRVLFLAHRRELIKQTCDKLSTFGVPAGIIMNGFRPNSADLVQVASIQTLARRDTATPDYLVIDEAHHSPSNAYRKVLEKFPGARVVGLTATPFRLDGRGLADVFDHFIPTKTPSELRDAGFLCPAVGWIYRQLDTAGIRTVGGDFDQTQLANLDNTILGDVVGEWLSHFREHPVRTILFACGVEHSRQFVRAFQAAGVAAEHLDGETPTAERDAILARVRAGTTHILSNCNVATEGFDLPELTCCILARPTKSLCMYLQQVGRVLRPAPGKPHAVIHDHANCMVTHGTPYDESREFIPTRTRKRQVSLTAIIRCSKCGGISDERVCPQCGHALPGRAERSGPVTMFDVEAVALEDLEREQTEPSNAQGMQRFKKMGQTFIGDFLKYEEGEGPYGPEQRYWFQGARSAFYIPATKELHRLLTDAKLSLGDRCRMVYIGDKETRGGYQMKTYKLFVGRLGEPS